MPKRWASVWGVGAVTSIVACLGVSGVVGYLIGGTVLAIALPLATILLGGVSLRLGLRLRRQRLMGGDIKGHS